MSDLPTFDSIMRIIDGRRRLQGMVDAEFNSFRCTDYRRRRAAALKGRKLAGT